jgi:uncharacterized protein (DUF1697 family)
VTVYVALLRGINVGGRSLKMDALREIAVGAGFDRVSTYIQSGNVLFRSRLGTASVAATLHDAILDGAGIDTTVVIRTAEQMRGVAAGNPWPDRIQDPTRVSVSFLYPECVPTIDDVDPAEFAPDEVVVVGQDAYLSTPNGLGRSKLVEPVLKRLGLQGTVRNWRSVAKLTELAQALQ